MGAEEQRALRQILAADVAANIVAWNRACRQDILASVACGFVNVHISVPISDIHIQRKLKQDRQWMLAQLADAVKFAQSFGCVVSVGAEDASRASNQDFLMLAETAARLGVVRIRYADTIGCLEPFGVYTILARLVPRCPLPIEFHAHNDFGLAVANSLAAVSAGARFISVTVGGIGERAGNAALEEVVAAAQLVYGWDAGIDLSACRSLTQLVARASGRPIFPYKPVSGGRLLADNMDSYVDRPN